MGKAKPSLYTVLAISSNMDGQGYGAPPPQGPLYAAPGHAAAVPAPQQYGAMGGPTGAYDAPAGQPGHWGAPVAQQGQQYGGPGPWAGSSAAGGAAAGVAPWPQQPSPGAAPRPVGRRAGSVWRT